MKRVLLFGGTSDSRKVAEVILGWPVALTVSVTTDYGAALLPAHTRLAVRTGAMDADAMAALMAGGGFDAVVDATHPYAREASPNIRAAAARAGLPCLRLLREAADTDGLTAYPNLAAAIDALGDTEDAILAATGSKELAAYTALPDFARRVFPRVLPTVQSVAHCIQLGFTPAHIIALQGPFGYDLNLALMRQYNIRYMVTKDGGRAGGFDEKIAAARAAGAAILLIARPEEPGGLSPDELLTQLKSLLEVAP